MKEITIASLNLNGETWNLNNKMLRVSKKLLNADLIIKEMTKSTQQGLGNILNSRLYDIIAVQELVYFYEYHNDIKECIESNGYKLIEPLISGRTHFTVGFIIKNELERHIISDEKDVVTKRETNRFSTLKIRNGNVVLDIINVHIKEGKNTPVFIYEYLKKSNINEESQCVLVGDFNSYSKQQNSKKSKSNNDLIKNIKDLNFTECGYDNDYTFISNGKKKKLDHIFISKGIKEIKQEYKTIDNDVNFCIKGNENDGFTDHSMLIARLD